MAQPQLNELLYGLFYDIFRKVANIPLNIDQLDSLRRTTDKITKALQDEIKDGIKRLAVITIQEMKAMETRLLDGPKNPEKTRDS